VVASVLLGATSLAQAAPPLGDIVSGGPSAAHTVHTRSGVMLDLSTSGITPAISARAPQRLDEVRQALGGGLQGLSARSSAVDADVAGNTRVAFAIHWHNHPDNVSPEVVSLARNFRRNGLPIVHLWESGRNLVAIGLNPHGKPGIYFTQKLPD